MESTSNIIGRIRKATGLSQDEFAKKIGVTKSYISNIESGYKSPSDRILLDIEEMSGEKIISSLSRRASAFLSRHPTDEEFKEFIERELQQH
jgi:transcriptional regulator with XRE-family HTH domain